MIHLRSQHILNNLKNQRDDCQAKGGENRVNYNDGNI